MVLDPVCDFSKRPGETLLLDITARVFQQRTAYQEVVIVDTVAFGRALFLDGKMQSTQADEATYHEALVHPALLACPEPQRVLVIGGGEGATLREVLRHPSVRAAVMVDIDDVEVRACRDHLPSWHQGSFDDPRTTLIHTDARAYLERETELFDTIVCDVTDPLRGGPAYRLFTREFYELCRERLTAAGTFVAQAESVDLGACEQHLTVVTTLRQVFPFVTSYAAHVPSFGESWGFAVASGEADVGAWGAAEVDARLVRRGVTSLIAYDGQVHVHMTALPLHLRRSLAAWNRVCTDAAPIFVD